jgi:hypothetical protein
VDLGLILFGLAQIGFGLMWYPARRQTRPIPLAWLGYYRRSTYGAGAAIFGLLLFACGALCIVLGCLGFRLLR